MTDFAHESGGRADKPSTETILQPLVTCGICTELYLDPVAFLDCMHIACGSCAIEWLARSSTCPQCRGCVRGIRDSHHATSLVEVYQTVAPNSDLCHGRTTSERQLRREQYRPGHGTVSHNQTRTSYGLGQATQNQNQATVNQVLRDPTTMHSNLIPISGDFDFGPILDFTQLTSEFLPEDVNQLFDMSTLNDWPGDSALGTEP